MLDCLDSLGEIIGQTIKLPLTASSQKLAKNLQTWSGSIQNIVIKVNS